MCTKVRALFCIQLGTPLVSRIDTAKHYVDSNNVNQTYIHMFSVNYNHTTHISNRLIALVVDKSYIRGQALLVLFWYNVQN